MEEKTEALVKKSIKENNIEDNKEKEIEKDTEKNKETVTEFENYIEEIDGKNTTILGEKAFEIKPDTKTEEVVKQEEELVVEEKAKLVEPETENLEVEEPAAEEGFVEPELVDVEEDASSAEQPEILYETVEKSKLNGEIEKLQEEALEVGKEEVIEDLKYTIGEVVEEPLYNLKSYPLMSSAAKISLEEKERLVDDINMTVSQPTAMIMSMASRSGEWDLSGGTASGSFATTIGGQYSTTAEVVGNEVIWRISISHGNITGTNWHVQGITLKDINLSEITEMTSTSFNNVYPPRSGMISQGMFMENKELYAYKSDGYSNNKADTTTFVVRQPIGPAETNKTVRFKAAVINMSNLNAQSPSKEITLSINRAIPTTGEVTLRTNMIPAGEPGPTSAIAMLSKNGVTVGGMNLNEPVSLEAGTYTVSFSVPDGYQLYTGEVPTKTITVTAGTAQDVTYNLVKSVAPNTGKVTFAMNYIGEGTKPAGLTAVAVKEGTTTPIILQDGVQTELEAGIYRIVPSVPEGYEIVGNNAVTLTLYKGGVTNVPFTMQKATQKFGGLKFTVSVPAGVEKPTDVKAVIVTGTIPEGEVQTLKTGIYEVVLNVPPGYALAPGQEQKVKVEVKENQLSEYDFKLVKSSEPDKGTLTLKVDYMGEGVKPSYMTAEAKLTTGSAATTLVDNTTTSVETGRYIVTLNVPDGYEVVGNKYYIVDLAKDKNIDVNFAIRKAVSPDGKGHMKLNFVEYGNNNVKIVGAKVRVSNGTNVYEGTTDSNGVVEFKDLPVGKYNIEQLTTQAGYYVMENIPPQEVVANNVTVGTIENNRNPSGVPGPSIIVDLRESDLIAGKPIPGVKIKLTDDIGNTYFGYTGEDGKVVFGGLSKLRTYTATAVEYPYIYGTGERFLKDNIIFNPDPTAPPITLVKAKLDLVEKHQLDIIVFEEGDSRVKIANAQIKITPPNGDPIYLTTDSSGHASVMLPELSDYIIEQITTDGTHIINPEKFTRFVQRQETVEISNKLINPASVKKDIKVKKVWEDAPPTSNTAATIELLADGQVINQASILPNQTHTFIGLRKYDDNHKAIKYTVNEKAIENYYAVYTKNDVDGYDWTVSNYEGYSVGKCDSGSFWVSTTTAAHEVTSEGKSTGKIIDMNTGEIFTNNNTFGYGIAVDHERRLLFAMNKFTKMSIYDLDTGLKKSGPIWIGIYNLAPGSDYGNSLDISRDGTKIFVSTWLNKKIYVYDTQKLIDAASRGVTANYETTITTTTAAGDLLELPNGDLLISGDRGYGSSQIGTGLWVHKKNSDGTYSAPKQIGLIRNTDGVSNTHSVEGLALVNGEVVITRPLAGTGYYGVFKLSPMPSYDLPSSSGDVFTATRLGDYNIKGVLADAASNANSPCDAFVNVAGTKKWLNDNPEDRPESIVVRLYKDGVATDQTLTVTPDQNGNWEYKFKNLPKFGEDGNRIKYTVKEENIPPGYTVTNPDGIYNNDIVNTLQAGNLYIQKKDDNNGDLAGAEFTLYKQDKQTIYKGPEYVNERGALAFENLKVGTYYLKETKAPLGYELDKQYYKVDVTLVNGQVKVTVSIDGTYITYENNMYYPFEVINKKVTGQFELKKVDNKGNIIQDGATFELRDENGNIIQTKVTGTLGNQPGYIIFEDLEPGKYNLYESITPEGYENSNVIYEVVVDDLGHVRIFVDGNEVSASPLIVVNNKPVNASFKLKKIDADDKTVLNGATFELRDLDGNIIQTKVTGENGEEQGYITFDNLPSGDYVLIETIAPDGYINIQVEFQVNIDEQGNVKILKDGVELPSDPLVVENRKPLYPDTGGIGIIPYLAAGIFIMIVAERYRRKQEIDLSNS